MCRGMKPPRGALYARGFWLPPLRRTRVQGLDSWMAKLKQTPIDASAKAAIYTTNYCKWHVGSVLD